LKSGKSQKIDLFLFSSVFSSNFHKNQKTDDFQKQKEKADFTRKRKKHFARPGLTPRRNFVAEKEQSGA